MRKVPETSEAVGVFLLIYVLTAVILFLVWLESGAPWAPAWLR